MNVFDIILCVLVVGCGFVGLLKGFVRIVFLIGSVFMAFWVAPQLSQPVARILLRLWPSEVGTQVLGFLISFAFILGVMLLIGKLFSLIVKKGKLDWLDRLVGVLLGLLVGILAGGFLVYLVDLGVNHDRAFWKESRTKGYFVGVFRATVRAIPEEFEKTWEEEGGKVKKEVEKLQSECGYMPRGKERNPLSPVRSLLECSPEAARDMRGNG